MVILVLFPASRQIMVSYGHNIFNIIIKKQCCCHLTLEIIHIPKVLLFINGDCKIPDMAFINGAEWIIVILIIVILFFGAKKIPELARSLGKASSEFQRARIDAKKTIESDKDLSAKKKCGQGEAGIYR